MKSKEILSATCKETGLTVNIGDVVAISYGKGGFFRITKIEKTINASGFIVYCIKIADSKGRLLSEIKHDSYCIGYCRKAENHISKLISQKQSEIARLQEFESVLGKATNGISSKCATIRIRQAIEFGKYKAWNSEVGEQKAQLVMDAFHNGLYGSRAGMWVQVNEAVELMETFFGR